MSLFEILVVVIVGFLVAKPEDFPKIIRKFREMRAFITNTKQEIMSHLDPITELKESALEEISVNLDEEMDQMNFYLEKIANLGSEYEGEYSLTSIKEHYRKVVKAKMKLDN
jgi:Sec-independent protein translocase protein TatA